MFRLGFAQTRRDARQLVSHAHFTVNGKKVNIPSYQVKAGDVIEVRESSRSSAKFAKLVGPEAPVVALPSWLNREAGTLKGVVTKLPERSDIDYEVAEHLSSSCTPSNPLRRGGLPSGWRPFAFFLKEFNNGPMATSV